MERGRAEARELSLARVGRRSARHAQNGRITGARGTLTLTEWRARWRNRTLRSTQHMLPKGPTDGFATIRQTRQSVPPIASRSRGGKRASSTSPPHSPSASNSSVSIRGIVAPTVGDGMVPKRRSPGAPPCPAHHARGAQNRPSEKGRRGGGSGRRRARGVARIAHLERADACQDGYEGRCSRSERSKNGPSAPLADFPEVPRAPDASLFTLGA